MKYAYACCIRMACCKISSVHMLRQVIVLRRGVILKLARSQCISSCKSSTLGILSDCKMSQCQEYIPKPIASEPFIIFSLLQVSMNILQQK